MDRFTADVERNDGWWIVQLREERGLITQVRRLEQVQPAVRDALSLFPELTDDAQNAIVNINVVGAAEIRAREVKEALERAREEERRCAEEVKQHARTLAETGYSYRDIAQLLGISYGRVGQMMKPAAG